MKKNIFLIMGTAVVVLCIDMLWLRPVFFDNGWCLRSNAPEVDVPTANDVTIDAEGLKIRRPAGEVLYSVDYGKEAPASLIFTEVVSHSVRDARFALILQSEQKDVSYGMVDTLTGEYRTIIRGKMDDSEWSPRERVLLMASSEQEGESAPRGLYITDLRNVSTLHSPEFSVRNVAAGIGYEDMHFKTAEFSPDGREIYFTYSPTGEDFKQASTSLAALVRAIGAHEEISAP